MSDETSNKEKMNQPGDKESADLQEAIETIKHPPAIDDVIRNLSPEEKRGNQAVAPEMLDGAGDLRHDIKRDE